MACSNRLRPAQAPHSREGASPYLSIRESYQGSTARHRNPALRLHGVKEIGCAFGVQFDTLPSCIYGREFKFHQARHPGKNHQAALGWTLLGCVDGRAVPSGFRQTEPLYSQANPYHRQLQPRPFPLRSGLKPCLFQSAAGSTGYFFPCREGRGARDTGFRPKGALCASRAGGI
jgi:hypothetical protein